MGKLAARTCETAKPDKTGKDRLLGDGDGLFLRIRPNCTKTWFRWINGRDPRQYGFDFGLWSRQIVGALIEWKFALRLGVTAVGMLLAKLGLKPAGRRWLAAEISNVWFCREVSAEP